jgi:hypothetical protein
MDPILEQAFDLGELRADDAGITPLPDGLVRVWNILTDAFNRLTRRD